MPYRVQLENFEGPLDLLLFLIKKNEVDVHDIPIAKITAQYLQYLEIIEFLDLENAGEFVLMAATLIRIKAQMLLPRPELEDEEAEDPREELVQRLLEYQSYKEVAGELAGLEDSRRDFYPLNNFAFELDEQLEEEVIGKEVGLYDLMSVFIEVLRKVPPVTQHTVERIPVTTEQQSEFILDYLEKKERALFTELMTQFNERIILIVTFVALLELAKNNRLQISQNSPFSEIWISRVDG
ncbi:segregation/condensation protein A [candidate division KSB1 bacterium]|nr:segregation/condensation protein A [candidate division KSB1 bacterium]NIR72818.1 segregation/condensation protein A [candidate division KSB1 bacterium]NIS26858.1 segregation/condensation protein A [candidate division KSB1 bacterium]NIT73654.1 segregation/condensation protein A [candidate division KSB1 bacterium]NIU27525.1 segregation/condensation protein A [candidate division KSB1 bacterium]